MNDFEARLMQLTKQQEELDQTLQKLDAIRQIQYIMGKFVVLLQSPISRHEIVDLYADRPDSSHESHTGYYVGMDALRGYFCPEEGFEAVTGYPEVGTAFEHHLATPTIQVAGDGKTARGLWQSPGCETRGGQGANGRPQPLWCYGKFLNDFINENGVWKIWHTHFYVTFYTPFHVNWVDVDDELRKGGPGAPDAVENHYRPDGIYKYIPAAPEPYDTWTDDRMRP